MNYQPTTGCFECGSEQLYLVNDSELTCENCGMVVEILPEMDILITSNDSPEYGDKAKLTPDRHTPAAIIMANSERLEEDLRWTIPAPKKKETKMDEKTGKSIRERYQIAHSRIGLLDEKIFEEECKEEKDNSKIDRLRDELLDAQADFEQIRKKASSIGTWGEERTPQQMEQWAANNSARSWLRLANEEEEVNLNPDSKSTLLELNKLEHRVFRWACWWEGRIRREGFVDNLLWKNGVPERSLRDEDGKARIIPSHERVGIEAFIALVGRGDAFWFFDDFSKKARMNASLIGRILREDLPIARSAGHSISSMNQRLWMDPGSMSDFIRRCAEQCGTEAMGIDDVSPNDIPLPPVELWDKLGMGPKGEGRTIVPRYWAEMWDKTPRIEQVDEEKVTGRARYEDFDYHQNEEEQEVESAHHSDWYAEFMTPGEKEEEPERWGYVRQHDFPILLRHIPLAYFIAQEFWNRRTPNYRSAAVRMLDLIASDLEWCASSVEEMDAWWESHWGEQTDGTPSVTTLRVTGETV